MAIKQLILLLLSCLCVFKILAQDPEANRFTIEEANFCRTASSSLDNNPFPPQYSTIVKKDSQKITLEDWEKNCLPLEKFLYLDTITTSSSKQTNEGWHGDWELTKAELDADLFMGSVQSATQDTSSLRTKIPDYHQYIRRIPENRRPNITEEMLVSNYTEPPRSLQNLNLELYKTLDSYPTKTYTTLLQDIIFTQKVSLAKYTELHIEEQKYKDSFTIHIGFFLILVMVALVTELLLVLQNH